MEILAEQCKSECDYNKVKDADKYSKLDIIKKMCNYFLYNILNKNIKIYIVF